MEDLNVFTTVDSLQDWLNNKQACNEKVSLVPTMGALHHGHIELVHSAFSHSKIVVVSIFVNPAQFNNEEDLIQLPKNTETGYSIVENQLAMLWFLHLTVGEMYP